MNYNLVQKFSPLKKYSKKRLSKSPFMAFYTFTSLLLLMLWYNSSNAQSTVTFDAGQTFSKFKYSDSQGAISDFTNNISGCFSIGYSYIGQNGIIIRSNAGMRKGGASLVYNETNVDWSLQYADLNVGAGYSFNRWMVKPYVVVLPYVAYMLKGEQKIGDNTYNVIKNKTMSTLDYGVCFVPGVKVALTNTIAFYAEYKQILGLQNLEVASNNSQKTFNRGFSVNLGVAISFIKYNYVTTQ